MRPDASSSFTRYFDEIARSNTTFVGSMDVIELDAIYDVDSEQHERYLVRSQEGEPINEALVNLAVISLGDHSRFLVLGEIVNNSLHYSDYYSDQVEGSYLSYAVGGHRISTNLAPGKEGESQLGTSTPVAFDELADEGYLGQELSSAGYQYYYLYTPTKNYWGETVAYMAVGIREAEYSNLIHNNMKAIFIIAIVIVPIVIVVSWLFSSRITRPLKTGKKMAENVMQGDFEAVKSYPVPENPINESDQLVATLRTMASSLDKSQQRIRAYMKELKASEEAAHDLSEQLLLANDNLEATVDARTLELQQLTDRLTISNSTKTRFIANISHELKTPLTSCISASDLLLAEMFGTLNEKQRDYVNNIRLSSSHLLLLINDILAMAKIDEGNTNLHFDTVTIRDVVDEVANIVAGSYPARASDIRITVEPEDLTIAADSVTLRQILYNLLSNAAKFSDVGSEIRIDVREAAIEGTRVTDFSISDQGIGIAQSDLERVFYEFEQVENSYSRTYEGTGLGLPLARRQTELHGGKLWLESTLGLGTTARFFLPAAHDAVTGQTNFGKQGDAHE